MDAGADMIVGASRKKVAGMCFVEKWRDV